MVKYGAYALSNDDRYEWKSSGIFYRNGGKTNANYNTPTQTMKIFADLYFDNDLSNETYEINTVELGETDPSGDPGSVWITMDPTWGKSPSTRNFLEDGYLEVGPILWVKFQIYKVSELVNGLFFKDGYKECYVITPKGDTSADAICYGV